MDDGSTVTVTTLAARVLLIAEDRKAGEIYRRVLEFVGYEVTQAINLDDGLDTSPDADVIVLCNRAALAYRGQAGQVIRVHAGIGKRLHGAPCPSRANQTRVAETTSRWS